MRSTVPPGTSVTFGIFDCSLGKVLVAATPVGVCGVAFAETPEALHVELRERVPGCRLWEDTRAVAPFADALVASLASGCALHLPLAVQGTAFQQRVWRALAAIPRGKTCTYAQLAQDLGLSRTSARAVAQACAANPVALAIPCHRVVGAAGELRGYRWGMERKRQLLLLEQTSR